MYYLIILNSLSPLKLVVKFVIANSKLSRDAILTYIKCNLSVCQRDKKHHDDFIHRFQKTNYMIVLLIIPAGTVS